MSRWRFLLLAWIGGMLLSCSLLSERGGQETQPMPSATQAALAVSPTALPTQPLATALPSEKAPSPSPSPISPTATARPHCTLTAKEPLTVYRRPSREAQLSGRLPAGTTLQALYRTPEGWYGFDPGPIFPKDEEKVGMVRLRWVAGEDVQASEACAQLPVTPALPAEGCLMGAAQPVPIFAQASEFDQVATLTPETYALVLARSVVDETRLQVQLPDGTLGWIDLELSSQDIALDGPCDQLPLMSERGATPAPTPSPTAMAVLQEQGHEARIRFAPGAVRWERFLIPQVDTYVFHAAKGQSVGIAVVQGRNLAPVTLALQKPDGTFLQTLEDGRSNWRGLILEEGDYRIQVAFQGFLEGAVLQVHAYPPLDQYQQLSDPALGYTLFYDPADFGPSPGWVADEWKERTGGQAQCLDIITPELMEHTNLSEARVCIGELAIPQTEHPEEACFQASVPHEGMHKRDAGTWWVNGVGYRFLSTFDAGAGQAYDTHIFRTYVNDRCVAIVLFTHSSNIGNYDPAAGVHEFDYRLLWDVFERLFYTLRWSNTQP